MLYEAGEALRFDEMSIRGGMRGIVNVMRTIGMLPPLKKPPTPVASVVAGNSRWVRASVSGIVNTRVRLGESVEAGQIVATVSDPYGEVEQHLKSPVSGVVIGRSNLPLAHEGDALLHIATIDSDRSAQLALAQFQARHDDELPA